MTTPPIVVGVDGSEASKRALRWAAEQSKNTNSPLEAIHAWQIPAKYGWPANLDDLDPEALARQELEAAVRETLGEAVTVSLRVERGHAATVLVAASQDASLLVVGSRGHGAFSGMLLGSVSQHCVQHSRCPVVVIPDTHEQPN